MPHYTTFASDSVMPKVCKYCGRPLKVTTSLSQGCGDVCLARHHVTKCRTIIVQEVPANARYAQFEKPKSE